MTTEKQPTSYQQILAAMRAHGLEDFAGALEHLVDEEAQALLNGAPATKGRLT